MRGPAVNTGPLFRAIKQFPCTHGIMFLLFSIGQNVVVRDEGSRGNSRELGRRVKMARNRGSRRRSKSKTEMEVSIRSFLDSRAAIRYRHRSITDRFSKIATNPQIRLELTRSLLDSSFYVSLHEPFGSLKFFKLNLDFPILAVAWFL